MNISANKVDAQRDWLSFHLYYHDKQNLLLELFIRPLIVDLLSQKDISLFFFVRYLVGGPHIRLRLKLKRGSEDAVAEKVRSGAEAFFRSLPSQKRMPDDAVLEAHKFLLSNNPLESDDTIYPDNFCRRCAFSPEVERYGGPELFEESFKFFALTSGRALQFISRHEGTPDIRISLSFGFRLLMRYALGFSRDLSELLELLKYSVGSWSTVPDLLVTRGDRVFDGQKDGFLKIIRDDVMRLALAETAWHDYRVARCFEGVLEATQSRFRVLSSQLHMTANRLGLSNAEEVYVGRLMWRTARELIEREPEARAELEMLLAQRAAQSSFELPMRKILLNFLGVI